RSGADLLSWRFQMIRRFTFCLVFLASPALFASSSAATAPASAPAVMGVVADPTGAIVPGAQVDLVDDSGAVTGSCLSSGDGSFQVTPPHPGAFTLVVSEAGFETIKTPIVVAA